MSVTKKKSGVTGSSKSSINQKGHYKRIQLLHCSILLSKVLKVFDIDEMRDAMRSNLENFHCSKLLRFLKKKMILYVVYGFIMPFHCLNSFIMPLNIYIIQRAAGC